MDRGGWHYPSGDFRVSDADRDRAVSELSTALQAGRITAEEFDERSGQALAARTGTQLSALLADLPAPQAPAPRTTTVDRAHRVMAARVAAIAAVVAFCVAAAAAASTALSVGPTLQQRQIADAFAKQQGLPNPPFPPGSGFDWTAAIKPAAIAVLLVVLAIVLRVRAARADRH